MDKVNMSNLWIYNEYPCTVGGDYPCTVGGDYPCTVGGDYPCTVDIEYLNKWVKENANKTIQV